MRSAMVEIGIIASGDEIFLSDLQLQIKGPWIKIDRLVASRPGPGFEPARPLDISEMRPACRSIKARSVPQDRKDGKHSSKGGARILTAKTLALVAWSISVASWR